MGSRHSYPIRLITSNEQVRSHVVVVGNPLPIPRMFRALPFAEEEAVEVKDMLNKAGVVVRDFFRADQHPQATKAALVQSLQGAKLAHIACHADIDTD